MTRSAGFTAKPCWCERHYGPHPWLPERGCPSGHPEMPHDCDGPCCREDHP